MSGKRSGRGQENVRKKVRKGSGKRSGNGNLESMGNDT
jgi:hypothetical protein